MGEGVNFFFTWEYKELIIKNLLLKTHLARKSETSVEASSHSQKLFVEIIVPGGKWDRNWGWWSNFYMGLNRNFFLNLLLITRLARKAVTCVK